MKTFFTRLFSVLLPGLILVFISIPALKANSEFISLDTIPKNKIDNQMDVYTRVKKMPQFPGGKKALQKFLSENIKYPEQAKQLKFEGMVIVEFLVDKTGKIINPLVVRGIGGGCDQEAQRVVKLMPDWTPGYQKGKAVNVRYHLPIRFRLN